MLELLSNSKVPESIRSLIAANALDAPNQKTKRDIENKRYELENKSRKWNTPLVATIASLATLLATFTFDKFTLEGETFSSMQLDSHTAQLAAFADERKFQYELVMSELSDKTKTDRERAETLLFLAKAGILNQLRADQLEIMAQEVIDGKKATLPSFNSRTAVSSVEPNHPIHSYKHSIGKIQVSYSDGKQALCSGLLISETTIATMSYCVKTIDGDVAEDIRAWFELEGNLDVGQVKFVDTEQGMELAYLKLDKNAKNTIPLEISIVTDLTKTSEIGMIYFNENGKQEVTWGGDCKVTKIHDKKFDHSCLAARGAAGSPFIDVNTGKVIGLHARRNMEGTGGSALRLYSARGNFPE